MARDLAPDVIVMDIAMPELNGIDATRQITNQAPGVKVIALSMHSDRRFVAEMLKAGASGYLLKDLRVRRAGHSDPTAMANQILPMLVRRRGGRRRLRTTSQRPGPSKSSRAATEILTAREREVLQLLAEGKSTKQVAAALHVSVKTIETHRRQMMDKLDIDSLAGLIKYCRARRAHLARVVAAPVVRQGISGP